MRQNARKEKFSFSHGIECGIVRSNFSPFNLNILLLGVPKRKSDRRMEEVASYVARMGQGRKVYKVLVEKPEGKRPLGRRKCRREDGIHMDLMETGGGVCELDSTSSE
jgi:hypothetical protein